jgi:hypothetical protein
MEKVSTVIKCMDFRQDGFFKNWLKSIGSQNSDIISVAGSVKELAGSNDALKDWILDMIALSYNAHDSREIILTNHSTCGAYKIDDEEEEKAVQIEDMRKAENLIKGRFPDMEVKKYWLKLEGDHHHADNIEFIPID